MHLVALSLVVLLFNGADSFEDNDLYGISHVTYVTTNIELSRRFYTEVLGGMLVEGLSTGEEGVYGDSHLNRIFQKEILDARVASLPRNRLDEVGVPDIGDNGDYKVIWDFILFSNTLIQLMTFKRRDNGQVFVRNDSRRGNGFITSTHACLYADDSVIALQQIKDIIEQQDKIPGFPLDNKGFLSVRPVNSFAQRRNLDVGSFLFPMDNNFRLAVFRGPEAERLEISYRRGNGARTDLDLYCKEKVVFPLLSDVRLKNTYQNRPSKRFAGLSHTNVVSDNMKDTIKFYTDVLGGKLNKAKTANNIPIGTVFQRLVFQDEELEAMKEGRKPDEYFGIIQDRPDESQSKLDLGFILFDNFYMEPYRYYMNDSYRDVPSYLYRNWSSPAYTNNQHTGFWVKDEVNMASFIRNAESASRRLGLKQVQFNRAVNIERRGQEVQNDEYSDPFPENHKLAGYDYVYFKGSSGEQLVLTQFLGRARQTLKAAMDKYGAVSTAYDMVNPWKWDGFQRTCDWIVDKD